MNNILNRGLWIIFTVLTPLTFVGLFSQNSIPGDIIYPVKLGLESVGVVIFALTPEGRASYNTTLSDRRFDEAQQLLLTKTDSQGLSTLVNQVEVTQKSINEVQDPQKKQEVSQKLVDLIDIYQSKLDETQKKEETAVKQIEDTKKQLETVKIQIRTNTGAQQTITAPAPTQ